MVTLAYIVAGLAVVGAIASLIVLVLSYTRSRRLPGEAAGHAAIVNKALVAFLACATVAVSAISVGSNLARISPAN